MKKTLKRELKLFEIVESDAFVVSVCLVLGFFFALLALLVSFTGKGKRRQGETKSNRG